VCQDSGVKRDSKPVWPPLSLTPDEAAYELRVSRSTLYELLKSGEIGSSLIGPQTRRIQRSEIEAYLARTREAQDPAAGAA
jgi:excisionase family DNA binding protein